MIPYVKQPRFIDSVLGLGMALEFPAVRLIVGTQFKLLKEFNLNCLRRKPGNT